MTWCVIRVIRTPITEFINIYIFEKDKTWNPWTSTNVSVIKSIHLTSSSQVQHIKWRPSDHHLLHHYGKAIHITRQGSVEPRLPRDSENLWRRPKQLWEHRRMHWFVPTTLEVHLYRKQQVRISQTRWNKLRLWGWHTFGIETESIHFCFKMLLLFFFF